jgi:hypothetical protein
MTDTKRHQSNQPNRSQQQQRDNESWRDDEMERTRSEDRGRETREPSSVAHDRGRDSERRNFSSDREADELGAELNRETDTDSEDEADIDRPGRSNR